MTGTITYILSRAGYRAMNGALVDERRRLSGAEPPAAYVSYDARLLAGAGWYGYRIALKGGDRDMVRRALAMLAEYYIIRDGYEYYDGGVYVVGVLLRQRVPHYGIGGGAPTPEPDALNFYMPNGGTISLKKTGSPTVVELEYSLDGGATWTVWPEDGSGNRSLPLTAGQRMSVRNTSETSTEFSTSTTSFYQFAFDNTVEAHGNVNSLLCRNADSVAALSSYCCSYMFNGCTSLVSAPELPATTLAVNCYRSMFNGCTSLVSAPKLPATTLAAECYRYMFNGCTSLVSAPELPATTSVVGCYRSMFNGCTSLVSAPELPATTSASYCYSSMFNGCTSLVSAPELPATTLASYCYYGMFNGCTSLASVPELPATTLASYCYYDMFDGCTSLVSAPELPATTLASYCYSYMFNGCNSLASIRTLMTDVTPTGCITNWVTNVHNTGDFYCQAELTIPTGVSGIPSGWTRHDL